MTGGHISTVIKVWTDDGGDEKAVVVKVLGERSRVREDSSTLVTAMRVAEAGGVGAPVVCSFNNGLVYGYTVGEVPSPDTIRHTDHIQK